jgi:hypothetical protein
MRTDYTLYIIAIICFVAAIYAYATLIEIPLYLYALAVLGIIFLGLGYMVRPKSAPIYSSASTPPSTPELPPKPPKPKPEPEPKEEPKKKSTKKKTRKKKTTRRRRNKKT